MQKKIILLYGATGYSGRLIARQAAHRWRNTGYTLLLSARDAGALRPLGDELGVACFAVALDDTARLDDIVGAAGVYAVVNAAGPFSLTGQALAKAALRQRRHYIDINGEADVYKQLDDFGYVADQREIALISGAGHSAATSDVMLELALRELKALGLREIGSIRIAFSHVKYPSRGSAQTAWRMIREQTMVVRGVTTQRRPSLVLDYRPTGSIERSFDFGATGSRRRDGDRLPARRIAMACNLLDLLTARLTTARSGLPAQRIEAFIEMPEGARAFVQLGAMAAPLFAWPAVNRVTQALVDLLPEGPDALERADDRHTVLLEIDDGAGRTLIDWRVESPDPYDFTADCVIATIEGLAVRGGKGWLTPAEVLLDKPAQARYDKAPLNAAALGEASRRQLETIFPACRFERRRGVDHG